MFRDYKEHEVPREIMESCQNIEYEWWGWGKVLWFFKTDFIKELTDIFLVIIGENYLINLPWAKCIALEKVQHWNVYMDPCT